jgi:Mn-dependent DtxR family transcriptional regulator
LEDSYVEAENCLFTMKGKILKFIQNNPPVTSDDIQKEFDIKPSTVSEHLTDLEIKGLIRREKSGKIK